MSRAEKTDWGLIELVVQNSTRVLLHGPPGTGKTTIAHVAARKMGKKVYSVTLTEETSMAELRGHFVIKGGDTVWHNGPDMLAWGEGAMLVINEIDMGSGDVLTHLHCILDDPSIAQITLPTGETVRPAAGFQVVATMNGSPTTLPTALQDRFPVTIQVSEMHPEALAALPTDLRNAAEGSVGITDVQRRASIRMWFEFAKLREKIGAEAAAAAIFGGRAGELLDALKIKRAAPKRA